MPPADLDSRARILVAAETLFAHKGFAATSIKDIGRASSRNTALIHYYFTSKEQLYREVLRNAIEHVMGSVGPAIAGNDDDPETLLRAFVRAQAMALRARPQVIPLMVREMTDAGAAHASEQIHTLAATVFARVCALVENGQRLGIFRRDADPRFTAISLVAQLNWLMLARPAVGVLLGRGLGEVHEADISAFADHAADLVIGGLRARPAAKRATAASRRQPAGVRTRRSR